MTEATAALNQATNELKATTREKNKMLNKWGGVIGIIAAMIAIIKSIEKAKDEIFAVERHEPDHKQNKTTNSRDLRRCGYQPGEAPGTTVWLGPCTK